MDPKYHINQLSTAKRILKNPMAYMYATTIEDIENLYNLNYPLTKEVFYMAAFKGNLQIVKKLYELFCPWDADATTYAASNGHLECLKFLVTNGCPLNKELAIDFALRSKHGDCAQYLLDLKL